MVLLTLDEALSHLHIPSALGIFQPYWEESMISFPASLPYFLQPEVAVSYREWCGMSPNSDILLSVVCQRIQEDIALQQLAWHCHQLLYEHLDYSQISQWPRLTEVLGDSSGVFYLLVALAMVRYVQSVHQDIRIPVDVSRATCHQVACFATNYFNMTNGLLGITLNQIFWLRHYTNGRLFRLGRFEYMIKNIGNEVEVYRHKATRRVIALAGDGIRYNTAGYVAVDADTDAWTATLQYIPNAVVGFPILPQGMAEHRSVKLPLDQWEKVLQQSDLVLDMHIPTGGRMHLTECWDSLCQAVSFFARFFPEKPVKAITCKSWIFNNQLQEIKISSDNLACFQRELYLFPTKSTGQDGLWFIFLQSPLDLQKAPRDTSLQRAVADFLLAGNTWRGGGMFILVDDLDQFGNQVYRSALIPAV